MMRSLLIACSACLSLTAYCNADQTYRGNGLEFTYTAQQRVTVTGNAIKTIRIEGPNGSLMLLQNHGSSTSPDKLQKAMIKSLLKQLDHHAVALTHKTAQRYLLGAFRTGTYILYSNNNIPSESLLFTFKIDTKTICVITQMTLQHSKEAERMFAQIQKSLRTSTQ